MKKATENPLASSAKIAGVVALYWFVSISMVFLNKHLLSGLSLDVPMFVSWFQCVVTVAICMIFGAIGSIPRFEFFPRIALKVLPLSIVFVGMIVFNNLCLKYVGVAFYNVGRSLTTVCNVIFTYLVLNTTTSIRALAMCAIIVMGFFLGVDQEGAGGSLSYIGVIHGVLASVCTALNAIYIKRGLDLVDGDLWRLMGYNNVNAILLIIPCVLYFKEQDTLLSSPVIYDMHYWLMMMSGGAFGVAIGWVTMLQVQTTSPLTHNISGTAKACVQTILALQISHEQRSFMWWMSNALVLGGSMGYTQVRRAEMQQAAAAKSSLGPVK
eukprot:m.69462 g.69462  ORF g.69462 m.69462 type:complete len:325 (+) comp14250_c0_seq1:59-1033(+)